MCGLFIGLLECGITVWAQVTCDVRMLLAAGGKSSPTISILRKRSAPHFMLSPFLRVIRGSAVGITTGYGLDDRGVIVVSPGRVKNFHFSISCRPALWPIQTSIQWEQRGSFPGC
jgi:hypothetical protein